MNYIIFDLEWNNAYNYVTHSFMNEIIEIGAVKLNERLKIVDTYKQMIYPRFTKKLSSRCKRLTKITQEELKENGIDFVEAFKEFASWSRGEDNVFMSWSNSDLFVLSQNFVQYTGTARVDFIRNYCDAQKYCMSFISKEDNPNNNQVALERCAELFGIEIDTEALHRALTDCYVTAECLKKVYKKEKLQPYIHQCDSKYFERLLFKPYYITEEHTGNFDIDDTELFCPKCGGIMDLPEEFEMLNKSFKGATKCNYCMKPYWVFIRAKKNYDNVFVKVGYVEMNKKRARKLQRSRQSNNEIVNNLK